MGRAAIVALLTVAATACGTDALISAPAADASTASPADADVPAEQAVETVQSDGVGPSDAGGDAVILPLDASIQDQQDAAAQEPDTAPAESGPAQDAAWDLWDAQDADDGFASGADATLDAAQDKGGQTDDAAPTDTPDALSPSDAGQGDTAVAGACPPPWNPAVLCLHWGVCVGAVQLSCASGQPECLYAAVPGFEVIEKSCDGLDNDCNGLTDDDLIAPPAPPGLLGVCAGLKPTCAGAQGWVLPQPAVLPAWEVTETTCDGLDNDCDGDTDYIISAPPPSTLPGVCSIALQVCAGSAGWQNPKPADIAWWQPTESSCDNQDNDCDGLTDEALTKPNPPGSGIGLPDLGVCAGAPLVCSAGKWLAPDYASWSAGLAGAIAPTFEATETSCDGLDNDCNGVTDDLSVAPPPASLHLGVCAGQVKTCQGAKGWQDPAFSTLAGYATAPELSCDGADNDCDGATDEDAACPLWQTGGRAAGPMALSPDGAQLAWLSATGVHVLDAVSGAHLYDDLGHRWRATNVAFAPDGQQLASTGQIDVLRLVYAGYFLGPPAAWPIAASEVHNDQTWTALAWLPSGVQLAYATDQGKLGAWSPTQGVLSSYAAHKQAVTALALVPLAGVDVTMLISASSDGQVLARPWPAGTATVLANLGVPVPCLAGDGGGRVLIASQGLAARLIDIVSTKTVAYLTGTPTAVAARFSPNGAWMWSVDAPGTVRRWVPPPAGPPGASPLLLSPAASFAPPQLGDDDEAVDLAVGPTRVYVNFRISGPWSLVPATQTWTRLGSGHAGAIADLTVHGPVIATAGDDASGRLWSAAGALTSVLWGHQGPVRAIDFSGQQAVTAGVDYTARMWNLSQPAKPINDQTFGLGGPWAEDLAMAADATSVWAAAGSAVLRVAWTPAPPGKKLQAWAAGGQVLRVVPSPNQKWLAVATQGGAAEPQYRVLHAADFTQLWSRQDLAGPSRAVAWTPDGSRLALAGGQSQLVVVSAATGATLQELPGHAAGVTAVAFDALGLRLLSASADGTARVWATPPAAPAKALGMWTRHCPPPCSGTAVTGAQWLQPGPAGITAAALTAADDGSLMAWQPQQ